MLAAPVPAGQGPSRRATQRHPASEPVILTWIPGRCPKFESVCPPATELTLIATAKSQMTASSPRGTFSQAELTAERVITRCITLYQMPARYIRACQVTLTGYLARLHAAADAGAAVLAGPCWRGRARAEPPRELLIGIRLRTPQASTPGGSFKAHQRAQTTANW